MEYVREWMESKHSELFDLHRELQLHYSTLEEVEHWKTCNCRVCSVW